MKQALGSLCGWLWAGPNSGPRGAGGALWRQRDRISRTGKAAGADVYVTGDMKYHDAQQAVEMGLPMVDVSHYAGERPVLAKLAAYLQERFGTALDVVISEDEENFLQYR